MTPSTSVGRCTPAAEELLTTVQQLQCLLASLQRQLQRDRTPATPTREVPPAARRVVDAIRRLGGGPVNVSQIARHAFHGHDGNAHSAVLWALEFGLVVDHRPPDARPNAPRQLVLASADDSLEK